MKKKSIFPVPKTYQESLSLKNPQERYDTARSSKKAALVLAAVAGLAIGADVVHNGDIGPTSLVASGVLGAASSNVLRESRRQQNALGDAHAALSFTSLSQPKPTDINIPHN